MSTTVLDGVVEAAPSAAQQIADNTPQPAVAAASCCSQVKQASCCEPSAKPSCCGNAASSGCGCQ